MKRSKRNPPPQTVGVFWQRLKDDITRSDITVAGAVIVHADGATQPYWQLSVGPGVGPHVFEDLALGRRVAWSIHHCIDALRTFTGQDDLGAEDDPQMTLADAPLSDGHTPTIRIGGHA